MKHENTDKNLYAPFLFMSERTDGHAHYDASLSEDM